MPGAVLQWARWSCAQDEVPSRLSGATGTKAEIAVTVRAWRRHAPASLSASMTPPFDSESLRTTVREHHPAKACAAPRTGPLLPIHPDRRAYAPRHAAAARRMATRTRAAR